MINEDIEDDEDGTNFKGLYLAISGYIDFYGSRRSSPIGLEHRFPSWIEGLLWKASHLEIALLRLAFMISLPLVEFIHRDCLKHKHGLTKNWLMLGFSLLALSYFLGILRPACVHYTRV
jgi:hypothetical protein